jgi:RAD51-like protein 2
MTVSEVEDLIQQIRSPPTQNACMPLTQSAAVIMKSSRIFSTHWESLDKLLDGGIVQGHILELSGPPGSPKENIAIDIVSSFLEAGEDVIFVGSPRFRSKSMAAYTQTPLL